MVTPIHGQVLLVGGLNGHGCAYGYEFKVKYEFATCQWFGSGLVLKLVVILYCNMISSCYKRLPLL